MALCNSIKYKYDLRNPTQLKILCQLLKTTVAALKLECVVVCAKSNNPLDKMTKVMQSLT